MEFNNKEIRRKNPINRNNMFYSEEDFQFEVELGKNYIEQDMNTTVVLYEVDLENTNVSDIYQEANADEIRFKTPVEIHVVYELLPPTLESYDQRKALGFYVKMGKLNFGVYEATLTEMECDIKRGDYIGVQVTPEHMEYFTVTNDGRMNYDNEHMMFGYKPFYRSIECAVVDKNEFKGE